MHSTIDVLYSEYYVYNAPLTFNVQPLNSRANLASNYF